MQKIGDKFSIELCQGVLNLLGLFRLGISISIDTSFERTTAIRRICIVFPLKTCSMQLNSVYYKTGFIKKGGSDMAECVLRFW
jgi:hypothetical protein